MPYKRQHYVPQFFLRNLGERFFQFDKRNQSAIKANASNVSVEKDFYANEGIEHVLSRQESNMSTAIRSLLSKQNPHAISCGERTWISFFIALQMVRTRSAKEAMKRWNSQFIEPELELELHKKLDDESKADVLKYVQTDFMNDASVYADSIVRMRWCLLINKTSDPFWMSDHPVPFFNPEKEVAIVEFGRFADYLRIFIPLSPSHLLTLFGSQFDEKPAIQLIRGRGEIRFYQALQVPNCYRFVYSPNSDFRVAKEMLQKMELLGQNDQQKLP